MLTEKTHTGGFLMSEAAGKRSRENVTLASGQDLYPGAVLGKITATGKYAEYNNAASDGTQVAAGILYGRGDASAADLAVTLIARHAEVNGHELLWGSQSGAAFTAGVADLLAIGIIVR